MNTTARVLGETLPPRSVAEIADATRTKSVHKRTRNLPLLRTELEGNCFLSASYSEYFLAEANQMKCDSRQKPRKEQLPVVHSEHRFHGARLRGSFSIAVRGSSSTCSKRGHSYQGHF